MAGQTLSEIRGLLAAAGLTPRHRFGQNFLIDLNLMRKLVKSGDLRAADVVLEVGPGTGSLTEMILAAGPRVVSVEIDFGLAALLRGRFADEPRFRLVVGDALAGKHGINPDIAEALSTWLPAAGGAYKLVANLPYQIATPLLANLLIAGAADRASESDRRPTGLPPALPRFATLVCTIQKEVADRLSARPETDAYGPISVIAQTLAEVRTLGVVPAEAFWPRPGVQSAMVELRPRRPDELGLADVPAFGEFVHAAFGQRRKKLRRLVGPGRQAADESAFDRACVSADARPEQLTPEQFRALHRALSKPRE